MKIALVSSRQDRAGLTIRRNIEAILCGRSRYGDRSYELFEVEGRLIHADGVDREIDADGLIFLSRHASRTPVPVLTVHVTGNLHDAADLGGSPRTLPPADPVLMQAVLRELARRCPPGYRAAYEVTHHGPTDLVHPSFFVEIGSTEQEWSDDAAGRAVAESVLAATPSDPVPLIGFGGNHYAARQTEIALATRGAFGHMAHSREVRGIDRAMIRQMMGAGRAAAAYIDKKALTKEDLSHLSALLAAEGIVQIGEKELAALGQLSWETYRSARDLAGTISPDARCHVHALSGSCGLHAVGIDPVLLAETLKADERAFLSELEKLPLIHLSGPGNRVLPVFITSAEQGSGIINALNTLCVKIIRSNEITATKGDRLIVQRIRFDPEKARGLGIPAGPLYRELAGGRPVEVSGRLITPAMVSSGSELVIHIPGLENIA